ncbi:MAG: glycogen/starch synthase [Oscillospiraceae bacterium]
MEATFALPDGWYHGGLSYEFEGRQDINLMKGAMLMADAVTTVSPTYARELHYPYFAHGLQGVVDMVDHKLYGILNGIDVAHYNPESDPLVPYHFTIEDRTGKARCKREIQRLFGLNQESEWPLLG